MDNLNNLNQSQLNDKKDEIEDLNPITLLKNPGI